MVSAVCVHVVNVTGKDNKHTGRMQTETVPALLRFLFIRRVLLTKTPVTISPSRLPSASSCALSAKTVIGMPDAMADERRGIDKRELSSLFAVRKGIGLP